MRRCVICTTRYKKGSGITFHKFPTDSTRQLWLTNMKMENCNLKSNSHICCKHFTKDCFSKHATRTGLKIGSVPTILSDANKSEYQKSKKKTEVCENIKQERHCKNAPLSRSLTRTEAIVSELQKKSEPVFVVCENTHIKQEDHNKNTPSRSGFSEASKSEAQKDFEICKNVKLDHRYETAQSKSLFTVANMSDLQKKGATGFEVGKNIKHEHSPASDNAPSRSLFTETRTSESQIKSKIISEVYKNVPDHQYESPPSKRIAIIWSNIRHDHQYENTLWSTEKNIERVTRSLIKSQTRVKVLSRHVKRLKNTVASLKAIITNLKKTKKLVD